MQHVKKYIVDTVDKNTLQEIYTILKLYNNSTINKNIKEVVYEMCICVTKMDIDPIASTLICKNCGIIKELYGTVFEDEQFYYQEGQRTKHGTYDPSKHCRFWVERIQVYNRFMYRVLQSLARACGIGGKLLKINLYDQIETLAVKTRLESGAR